MAGLRPAEPAGVPFDAWLRELRQEALAFGVSAPTLDAAFSSLTPLPRVLELQRRQPERRLSYEEYLTRTVSSDRVINGRRQLEAHGALLEEVARQQSVQPRFVIALWGIESDFGRRPGELPVIATLATLARSGERRPYFRRELLEALAILDSGQIALDAMVGSWAGAMGQCQFMPSNYRRLAVDHDGDGRKDIWSTPADVFASTARFLSRHGWRDDQTWGRQVLLPSDFDARISGPDARLRLSRWQDLGVRRLNGQSLPTRDLWATMLLPDGPRGRAFLVYDNLDVLLNWNRSTHFALAVGQLADRLR
ncbi:lytic transglycosylase domain-containing protein [Candidatus Latescibacterota bacterium]